MASVVSIAESSALLPVYDWLKGFLCLISFVTNSAVRSDLLGRTTTDPRGFSPFSSADFRLLPDTSFELSASRPDRGDLLVAIPLMSVSVC